MSVIATPGKSCVVTPSNTNYITDSARVPATPRNIVCSAVNLSTETFTSTSHGLNNGDALQLVDAGTTNLTGNELLYVINTATDTFQLSLTIGGIAINVGGANTTAPTFRLSEQLLSGQRVVGALYIGGAGNVSVLLEDFPDTDTATEAARGAQIFSNVPAGTILPIRVKKVFATGTTATNIKCLYQ